MVQQRCRQNVMRRISCAVVLVLAYLVLYGRPAGKVRRDEPYADVLPFVLWHASPRCPLVVTLAVAEATMGEQLGHETSLEQRAESMSFHKGRRVAVLSAPTSLGAPMPLNLDHGQEV